MKRIVALCLVLLCSNRALLGSNKLVVTNYTLKPLYVAQVRTAARTQYKQYIGHPSQYDEVMIIPIDAFSVATVDADGESV